MRELLRFVAERAAEYRENLDGRGVAPTDEATARLKELNVPLPDEPTAAEEVVRLLDEIGSPATTATTGGRYFGFVIGGSLPAAQASSWLVDAWDQNATLTVMSPVSIALEDIAIGWLTDVLRLPADCGASLVTGATMANFVGLAAARHALLAKAGWDVEEKGLFGAPEITVVVGEEAHATVFKALAMLGFGRSRVVKVPVDGQGRMIAEKLPPLSAMTLVCVQAGNVNTGSFDPAAEICAAARGADAWVHVDGAFGLWAAASPEKRFLMTGFENADSWATDAHKWLNVTYDGGIAFVRRARDLRAAMAVSAAYLPPDAKREPMDYTPDLSRRARGVGIWAALLSLGKSGVADLIERTCRYAARFAEGLSAAGFEILNEVNLNQVLVSFGDEDATRKVIAEIQKDGTCWCGGTVWQNRTAMRISVSSWATNDDDVEKSLAAIIRIAAQYSPKNSR